MIFIISLLGTTIIITKKKLLKTSKTLTLIITQLNQCFISKSYVRYLSLLKTIILFIVKRILRGEMMIIIFGSAKQSKTVYASRTLGYRLNNTKLYDNFFFLLRRIKSLSRNLEKAMKNIN